MALEMIINLSSVAAFHTSKQHFSCARARRIQDLAVPSGTPYFAAISSLERPST